MTVTSVPDFSSIRVLVAGDVMLDRYWSGATSRISPEAPVPIVHVGDDQVRPGGAANVALNLSALGVMASLIGVVGRDEAAQRLDQALSGADISVNWLHSEALPTITKLRVMSRHQQVIRLDFEDSLAGEGAFDRAALIERFTLEAAGAHAVILSDYAKGSLRDVPALIAQGRALGKPLIIDPKGEDFSRYRGATLLTPNLSEFEAIVGACPDEQSLLEKGDRLCRDLELAGLLITRSEKGMCLIRADASPLLLPTEAREVFDVTGAGDTVIATIGASVAAGLPLEDAVRLANLAAGIVVGKLGTATANRDELARVALSPAAGDARLLSAMDMRAQVATLKARGRRVVMTNGVFDLLHVGHARYLEDASALGDVLIVAVNEDESVRRLKGSQRPINACADRMRLLASLRCVDFVVSFGEDTPARLISELLPDLLVKGGDYRPEDIAGGDAVVANGGEVIVLPFHAGYSSTAMIERSSRK